VLGCTHFPVLAPAIRAVLPDGVTVVDSAATTATALAALLEGAGLCRQPQGGAGAVRLLATDSAERFARVGGVFLGTELRPGDVELVDL
jgi:glutamate racemase